MTDYSELAKRLRAKGEWSSDKSWESDPDSTEAADALEAQAWEIAALRAAMERASLWSFEAQDGTPAIKELHDDIMRIRAALKGERV